MFGPIKSTYYAQTADGLSVNFNSIITPSSSGATEESTLILGIGDTYKRFASGDISYSFSDEDRQTGYKKVGGSVHGTIHPDSFFGVTGDTAEEPDQNDTDLNLRVFPNPVSEGIIHLDCKNCKQIQSLNLMTLTGQVVHTMNYPAPQQRIDMQTLRAGVYLIRLQFSDGSTMVRKVMVN